MTSSYWIAVAPPIVLIDAGQGLAFARLTSAGIEGVSAADAGASSSKANPSPTSGSTADGRHLGDGVVRCLRAVPM